jgi:hypothetical protein
MGTLNFSELFFRRMGTLAFAMLLYGCANVVSPTGGPPDEDPPVVVRSEPPNYSSNFSGGEVRIYFDEFVDLRNVRQQLMISPPLEQVPDFRVRGRSIVFDTGVDLRENTTYSIFLGDAIIDITESNAIPNFSFVFSTGDTVDSLSVRGKVLDAFTLEPVKDAFVMMYDRIIDSIPYLERPVYVAKTGEEGQFSIRNMREGEYLMFGLVDNNANYLYDLPEEKIAFIDSLVRPTFVPPPATADPEAEEPGDPEDTGMVDPEGTGPVETEGVGAVDPEGVRPEQPVEAVETAEQSEDPEGTGAVDPEGTGPTETADPEGEPEPGRRELSTDYTLYLFQEADTVQRITGAEAIRSGRLRMTFRVPADSVRVRDVRQELAEDWNIMEIHPGRDTLTLWLMDPQPDSLFLEISDRDRVLDTLNLSARPRGTRGRSEQEVEEALPEVQLAMDALRRSTWPYYLPVGFRASAPVDSLDAGRISIWLNDTVPLEGRFATIDPVRRSFTLDRELEEGQNYSLEFLPGAVTDIFGATNDTIRRTFTTTSADDYGKLIMNITLPVAQAVLTGDQGGELAGEQDLSEQTDLTDEQGGELAEPQFILQLLNQNRRILQEKVVTGDGQYSFSYLDAGEYGLRLIEDRNRNGKWDPGIYLEGILPEPVYMYVGQLQVRQNWELEMPWQPTR